MEKGGEVNENNKKKDGRSRQRRVYCSEKVRIRGTNADGQGPHGVPRRERISRVRVHLRIWDNKTALG